MGNLRLAIAVFLGLAAAVIIIILLSPRQGNKQSGGVFSFEECKQAGHKVTDEYPRRCILPSGESFTETVVYVERSKDQECPKGQKCLNRVCAEQ